MKERIVQFLASERISPAEFADKIGVQRSSMSHILNGRNHPSAAFLQKMLQIYPSLNPRWLMIGDGTMNITNVISDIPIVLATTMAKEEESPINQEHEFENERTSKEPAIQTSISAPGGSNTLFAEIDSALEYNSQSVSANESKPFSDQQSEISSKENQPINQVMPLLNNLSVDKEIEQILFFYKDKTFTVYRPS